jgi:hypothetical protein
MSDVEATLSEELGSKMFQISYEFETTSLRVCHIQIEFELTLEPWIIYE